MLTRPPRSRGAHARPRQPAGAGRSTRLEAGRVRNAVLLAFALAAVAAALLVGLRLSRPGALPNLELAGVDVGGMSEAEVRRVAVQQYERRGSRALTLVRPAVGAWEQASLTVPASAVGYGVDVDATVEAVFARGRQPNPLAALRDHLFSSFWTIGVEPVDRVDPEVLGEWARAAAKDLGEAPVEGDLEFAGTDVTAVDPVPGATVGRPDLIAKTRALALDATTSRAVVAAVPVRPRTTAEDVRAVLADARVALDGDVRLTRGKSAVTFTPEEIARVLDTRLVDDPEAPGDPALRLHALPGKVAEVVTDEEAAAVEADPVDATFSLSGGSVKVVPSKKGFALNPKKAAGQLVGVALSADRAAKLKGDQVTPELTTKEAKALRIDQQVSTFTTYHDCCQPRVTNIHRIADIIRGTVVLPGGTFSVNETVGMRTKENGFVGAPAIRDGKFVEEVGGGISQFATTIFNAIYFGGYDIVQHQAHSYYFTRYPMGREATVSWPAPDLVFRNDTDFGVYIHTSYTDTSITVTFYGHQGIEVDSVTGPQTNITQPRTECEEVPSMAPGESRVVQSGSTGFDVVVKRILKHPNGTSETESYFTRYRAEPIIVQKKSCSDGGG